MSNTASFLTHDNYSVSRKEMAHYIDTSIALRVYLPTLRRAIDDINARIEKGEKIDADDYFLSRAIDALAELEEANGEGRPKDEGE